MSSRILIVDDEPAIRGLLALTFKMAGYEVETAASGKEAISLCENARFDLVISDIMMPEMDGHELAQWVAARFPDTRTVLMTGYDGGCLECPYAPRCHLLYKPFRPAEALEFVREAMSADAPPHRLLTDR